ncbi:relaxase domain-containing protein [Acidithrix sp. C25]|uniref:relaxase domain-containing protein n=1 Tax=Acidithrix sp. C25 TaxID=1671482 RepID=UPI00191BA09C|nr:relaxase domain-containing protein [Acidithrix sp. C25]
MYQGDGRGAATYFSDGLGIETTGGYYSEGGSQLIAEHTWQNGKIVSSLGLDEAAFKAWVEGIDPITGEHRGGRGGGQERQGVRFVEFNVNNPKSLSIVASQNREIADALDEVLDRQADAISSYLSRTSVTRIGKRGAQEQVGGLVLSVARARHMTSR